MREDKYDFVKGIAISFVILLHTIDRELLLSIHHIYHIGQAVPLFILVTFVLSFASLSKRTGSEIQYWYSLQRWNNMIRKIWLPYAILQALFVVMLFAINEPQRLFSLVKSGGMGPGSYYPWVYLQFWLIMPFLYHIIKYKNAVYLGGAILLAINEIIQLGCTYLDVSHDFYRMFAGRYLFLAFWGYCFMKKRISKYAYVLFAVIGIIYYLSLGKINYVPWLYSSWMSQQLPAYFYTIVLMKLIIELYDKIKGTKFAQLIVTLGKYSWHVFLLQMLFVVVTNVRMFSFIQSELMKQVIYVIIVFLLCTLPVFAYDRYKIKLCNGLRNK